MFSNHLKELEPTNLAIRSHGNQTCCRQTKKQNLGWFGGDRATRLGIKTHDGNPTNQHKLFKLLIHVLSCWPFALFAILCLLHIPSVAVFLLGGRCNEVTNGISTCNLDDFVWNGGNQESSVEHFRKVTPSVPLWRVNHCQDALLFYCSFFLRSPFQYRPENKRQPYPIVSCISHDMALSLWYFTPAGISLLTRCSLDLCLKSSVFDDFVKRVFPDSTQSIHGHHNIWINMIGGPYLVFPNVFRQKPNYVVDYIPLPSTNNTLFFIVICRLFSRSYSMRKYFPICCLRDRPMLWIIVFSWLTNHGIFQENKFIHSMTNPNCQV